MLQDLLSKVFTVAPKDTSALNGKQVVPSFRLLVDKVKINFCAPKVLAYALFIRQYQIIFLITTSFNTIILIIYCKAIGTVCNYRKIIIFLQSNEVRLLYLISTTLPGTQRNYCVLLKLITADNTVLSFCGNSLLLYILISSIYNRIQFCKSVSYCNKKFIVT